MPSSVEQRKAETVDRVAERVRARLPGAAAGTAERFVRLFYRHVAPEDLVRADADNLYGAALGLWQYGAVRPAGAPKVRAYNPTYEEHGWHVDHTVVEIVNDDMPFLVDSVTAALNRLGLGVHLVIHPILRVERDAGGALTALHEPGGPDGEAEAPESFMHVEVDEQTAPDALRDIEATLAGVLADVRAAVEDWGAMRASLAEAAAALERVPGPVPAEEAGEAAAFLRWLDDDHFTFLGARDYRFAESDGRTDLGVVQGSGLGILRDPQVSIFEGTRHYAALPPDVQQFMRQPLPVMATKANRVSTVHRAVPLDALIVKTFDGDRVAGERIVVGLFTSAAYHETARDIPLLRRKVERTLARAGFDPRSHDGKALTHILDTYPRDELFSIAEDELLDIALGILQLQERQRTALFVRRDPFGRFVSCLVYVPRDRYTTELRLKLQAILEQAFGGRVSGVATQLTEEAHARVHVVVQTAPGEAAGTPVEEVERRLVEATRSWTDQLRDALIEARGEERGLALHRLYRRAFPTSYAERTVPAAAIGDIERIEEVRGTGGIALNLYRPIEAAAGQLRLKLYHPAAPVPLSDVLPVIEHLGFRVVAENPFEVAADAAAGTGGVETDGGAAGRPVWIHDFAVEAPGGEAVDLAAVKPMVQEAFLRIWAGEMEDDGFNALVLAAGLDWRSVVVLRAYAKYLRQARLPFGQETLERTLAAHPGVARRLARLFAARFDPAREESREALVGRTVADIEAALEAVSNADEDLILRRFLALIQATVRTTFYQPGHLGGASADAADPEAPRPALAFKLDSGRIDFLPLPRPWREIFVYAPRFEAVHLRGGKVARGGIRWSDRREDFRTEILGLMKAQMVKNGVIVPVGSKGGFVLKRPPSGREAFQAEGVACYRMMMRALLDLTDNLAGGGVVPPADTVRWDEDDPYLVVAADKGTAAFSDIANAISLQAGYWLGDAFASGGSAGYDHKAMGITARGAWESVRRHFREMGADVDSQDFTVVGVGDMAGDVFGNGMLLSPHIRLVGAFNHLHVFVDPDPDPAAALAERRRLFELGRGSWDQYDRGALSPGGAVFERSAKTVRPSAEVRRLLGLEGETATPAELIRALLRHPADLLYFGGIGTFVKAAGETHAEVGDKANDALRIDAGELRARVIGEGANLAVTQRGRIEAARGGVRLNTDFIDNSAGVDTSDHEVNIKILLGGVVAAGDMTTKQRNALLAGMTGEVAGLVLRDNYLQTQALTLDMAEAPDLLEPQARLMRGLERTGRLDRRVELLPDDEALAERAARREGLTRPEQAVLLAYAKLALFDRLLGTGLPDDPGLAPDLLAYFPTALRDRHAAAISSHPLRREIVATSVANSVVNRAGPTFVSETADKTGRGAEDVVRAYLVVRDVFRLRELWRGIEALDGRGEPGPGVSLAEAAAGADAAAGPPTPPLATAEVQTRLLLLTRRLVERACGWLLQNVAGPLDIEGLAGRFRPGVEAVEADGGRFLHPEARAVLDERAAGFVAAGVPEDLARRVGGLNIAAAGLDLVRIAEATGLAPAGAAPVYFAVGHRLGLAWLRDGAFRLRASSRWDRQAVAALMDDLYALQAELTVRVLQDSGDAPDPIAAWLDRRRPAAERIDQLIAELRSHDAVDLAMLTVASRHLRGLLAG